MNNEIHQVTKKQVECYKLSLPETSMYWTTIILEDNDKAGRLIITSDYGTWANYWAGCGMPFKEFLTKLEIDYTAKKLRAIDNVGNPTPQFVRFWNEPWKAFIDHLKLEKSIKPKQQWKIHTF